MREDMPPISSTSNADNISIPPQASLHSELHHSPDAPFLNDSNVIANTSTSSLPWWKTATCYQIWPASFKDSNGDGVGDIKGILSKLDYLADLGIDCIWFSPLYASPQKDMGYDISDYNAIHPAYGTMSDMEEVIAGCHNRGIRLILDLVVNHTSDQHKWFKESKKGRPGDGKYGDYYIWKDAKIVDGKKTEPNNWGSIFSGSAWEWCEGRQQYYLHIFTKEQPDLNWEEDHIRKAIRDSAITYWFEKGVDGFRVDTCNIYSKDQHFADGEVDERFKPWGNPIKGILEGPRMHEWWREIRKEAVNKYGDPLYAEVGGKDTLPPHEVIDKPYDLPEAKRAKQITQDLAMKPDGWATTFLENHDQPRSVNRHGTNNPQYWQRACKVLAMLCTTLSGTLFMYQGLEIGMTNFPESWSLDDLNDIASINYYRQLEKENPNDKELLRRAWKGIVALGRDNARTPVQWSSEPNAGFTTGKPWMRVNENYTKINVEEQKKSSDSVLAFWKTMIQIRKKHHDLFTLGSYKLHDPENELSWVFEKRSPEGGLAVVILNFSEQECELRWPEGSDKKSMKLVLSNVKEPQRSLGAWECRLYIQQ